LTGDVQLSLRALTAEDAGSTLVARIREVALTRPEALAVVGESTSLSYSQMYDSALATADVIIAAASDGRVGPDRRVGSEGPVRPVGVLLDVGPAMVVAMVGALVSGRPFVPLDPTLPPERMATIAALAGVRDCLTDGAHAATLAALPLDGGALRALRIEDIPAELSPARSAARAAAGGYPAVGPDDTTFIVFSSGSTGAPKGVRWRHQTIMGECWVGTARLALSEGDQVGLVLPPAFAAGLTVLFWGLAHGATLRTYDPRVRGIRDMPAWIVANQVTTLHMTPSLLRALADATPAGTVFGDVRLATTSGEPVLGRDVARLRSHLPTGSVFVNWAGASEIGSTAMYAIWSDEPVPEGPVPAGWPVELKSVTIVGPDGVPVPAGETGEVVVTSAHISGGYWNAPGPTAERFAPLPDGSTRYRAGDLGRFRADGSLELLGRRDSAVKIRGYLVEPAEVESALLASPDVVEAVVVTDRVRDTPRLVAYVVGAPGLKSATVTIRRYLREKLPAYLVPSAIVLLPALPRNERGKVDRGALPPAPPRAPIVKGENRNHWETTICDLYAQVLGVEEVGIHDDFLELGGDSLLAEELLSEMHSRLGVVLPTSVLVEAPTVAELAVRAGAAQREVVAHPTCVPLNAAGTRPPLFCVAGAGGLAINFLALARRLGPDQRVYGLQANGLENRAVPDWSVERHARRHLAIIRIIQPRGPYYLSGFSFGGLVAMEIAHLLEGIGETVALLTLFDTTLPRAASHVGTGPLAALAAGPGAGGGPTRNGTATAGGASADVSVPPAPGPDVPGPCAPGSDLPGPHVPGSGVPGSHVPGSGVPGSDLPGSDVAGSDVAGSDVAGSDVAAPHVARRDVAGDGAAESRGLLQRLLPAALTPSTSKLRKAAQLPFAGIFRYSGLTQFDVFYNQGRILTNSYRIRTYGGPTILYLAEQNRESGRENWPRYLTGDLATMTVPGEHHNMLSEPHATALAADLTERLAAAREAADGSAR
jgi:amino acid adenylation domain-containing protein